MRPATTKVSATDGFRWTARERRDRRTIHLSGVLAEAGDTALSAVLLDQLAVSRAPRLIVDLRDVRSMGASTIGILTFIAMAANQRGIELVVTNARSSARQVIARTGTADLLGFADARRNRAAAARCDQAAAPGELVLSAGR